MKKIAQDFVRRFPTCFLQQHFLKNPLARSLYSRGFAEEFCAKTVKKTVQDPQQETAGTRHCGRKGDKPTTQKRQWDE